MKDLIMQEDTIIKNDTVHRRYKHGLFTLFMPEKIKLKELWLETVDGNSYVRVTADGTAEILVKKISVL